MVIKTSDRNPAYSEVQEDWTLMRDAYKGERRVKSKSTTYLPYTIGHILDGAGTGNQTIGQQAYSAYKKRARFDNFVREAVQTAIGMMHSQPPEIKLPKAMEGIRSSKGEGLPDLLRKINVEQLITGRLGIMADMPKNPDPDKDLPYISFYQAERLINWDDGNSTQTVPQNLNLVVIDESEFERTSELSWTKETRHRILSLGKYSEADSSGVYKQGEFKDERYSEEGLSEISYKGSTLDIIPFIFINSCDLTSEIDEPPLLDLGNLCMTIYRGDADYRQNLYMQGQDTFVTMGANFDEEDAVRTGSGARIDLPMGGDAKYVGVESSGLEEQRSSLESLRARAGTMGAQTLDSTSRERESGDSLRIRVAARTADMNQIVETGAKGLEDLLKIIAIWIGEDPDEVSVKPNKEFGEAPLTGQTMVEIATAASLGYPISQKSMHDLALTRRMTRMTYEEEVAQAKKEDAETNPFKPKETADRAGPNQNGPGDKTQDDVSARNKAKQNEA